MGRGRRGRKAARGAALTSARWRAALPLVAAVGGMALLLALAVSLRAGDSGGALTSAVAPGAGGGAFSPAVGRQRAPDFALTLDGGERFALSEQTGRIVVLDFLSPGCPSCAADLAVLSRVAEGHRDKGVVVLVVDVGGLSRDEAADYYRSLGGSDELRYTADAELQVARRYAVRYLGTTVVIGRDGGLVYRDEGATSEEELAAAVEAAR